MRLPRITLLACCVLAGVAQAQTQAPAATAVAPAATDAATGAAQRHLPPEPNVQRTVIEDDGARVEELRVRGQVKRIVVQSKTGDSRYEIVPAENGRDISAGPDSAKGAVGKSLWTVLSF